MGFGGTVEPDAEQDGCVHQHGQNERATHPHLEAMQKRSALDARQLQLEIGETRFQPGQRDRRPRGGADVAPAVATRQISAVASMPCVHFTECLVQQGVYWADASAELAA